RDRVTLDGKAVRQQSKLYLLLHKPVGYITTYKDPEGRPTVYDLIADTGQFVGTVGRLDQDTSGLLLLSNDTQFAEKVTNPDHHVVKTYVVRAATVLTDTQLDRLRQGITLSDGPARPAIVTRVREAEGSSYIELQIDEGRNRQVRRMIEAIGSTVLELVRTAIGPITIGSLEPGAYRKLTPQEVQQLTGSSALEKRERLSLA
ncbi:MAG: pseudouridine synthase, partial [Acidobacteriota bacterium]|nr:pseudouridine synthase [Acidobacteriota bacterium]